MSAVQDLYWSCVETHKYKPLIAVALEGGTQKNSLGGGVQLCLGYLGNIWLVSKCMDGGFSVWPSGKGWYRWWVKGLTPELLWVWRWQRGHSRYHEGRTMPHYRYHLQTTEMLSDLLIPVSPNIVSDLKEGHKNQKVTNRTILLRSNDWCP